MNKTLARPFRVNQSTSKVAKQLWFKELESIAKNPETPQSTLWLLLRHPVVEIRMALIDNPKLSFHSHAVLVKDSDPQVRYALAENHNVSIEILTELTNDKNPCIADKAERTLARVLAYKQSTTLLRINAKDNRIFIHFRYGRPSYEQLCRQLWRHNLISKIPGSVSYR